MTRARLAIAVAGWVAAAGALGTGVVVRGLREGRAEMLASDWYLRKGALGASATHARRAAVRYLPGAGHVERAYARLAEIGTSSEQRGDRETALFAWRGARGAAVESSGIVAPHAAERARADEAIARIGAASVPRAAEPEAGAEDRLRAEYSALLVRDATPRARWVIVATAGFAAMLGGAVAAVRRGVLPDGRLRRGAIAAPAIVAAAGLAMWLVGIWRA